MLFLRKSEYVYFHKRAGDVIYRSTLDLELRNERGGLTSLGATLLGVVAFYFFAPPGVALGLLDYFVLGSLTGFLRKPFDAEVASSFFKKRK